MTIKKDTTLKLAKAFKGVIESSLDKSFEKIDNRFKKTEKGFEKIEASLKKLNSDMIKGFKRNNKIF